MDSLGIFRDINLKKSTDLMDVFEEAFGKTNNLMETMENFNKPKLISKNINVNNNEQEKRNSSNNIKSRKVRKFKTSNPNNQFSNNIYFKKRQPYNYQKEYENELINQIEELFHTNYKNDPKENIGMLSFLSPLISSNVKNKKKEFYKSNDKNNNRKSFYNVRKESTNINKYKSHKSINYNVKKIDDKEQKRIKEKKSLNDVQFEFDQEINRPINKAKTNAIKEIYFKSKKRENNSNVDLLINKLKKKYS